MILNHWVPSYARTGRKPVELVAMALDGAILPVQVHGRLACRFSAMCRRPPPASADSPSELYGSVLWPGEPMNPYRKGNAQLVVVSTTRDNCRSPSWQGSRGCRRLSASSLTTADAMASPFRAAVRSVFLCMSPVGQCGPLSVQCHVLLDAFIIVPCMERRTMGRIHYTIWPIFRAQVAGSLVDQWPRKGAQLENDTKGDFASSTSDDISDF